MRLGIRCDASEQIGTGHIMRLISIAEAAIGLSLEIIWFVNQTATEIIESRVKSGSLKKCTIVPMELGNLAIPKFVVVGALDCLLIDGYHFKSQGIASLKAKSNFLIALLDDNRDLNRPKVDIVINGGVGAELLDYQVDVDAKYLMLGADYYPLRREFADYSNGALFLDQDIFLKPRDAQNQKNNHIDRKSCLISFGGTDPLHLNAVVVENRHKLNTEIDYTLLLGSNTSIESSTLLTESTGNMNIMQGCNNMPALIADHDMAIIAAGGTLYECAFFSVPSLSIIVADNQARAAKAIAKLMQWPSPVDCRENRSNLIEQVNDFLVEQTATTTKNVDRNSTEHEMRENKVSLRKVVDGFGAKRVVEKLIQIINLEMPSSIKQPNRIDGYSVSLRPLVEEDLQQVLQWRNSPEVRNVMLDNSVISWSQHCRWFKSLCTKNDQWHFMVVYRGQNIGVANLKSDKDVIQKGIGVEIGLYIGEAKYRDNVLAFAPNLLLLDYCFEKLELSTLEAVVVAQNQRALKYNQALGYRVEEGAHDVFENNRNSKNYPTTESANQLIKLKLCRNEYKIKTAQLKKLLSR